MRLTNVSCTAPFFFVFVFFPSGVFWFWGVVIIFLVFLVAEAKLLCKLACFVVACGVVVSRRTGARLGVLGNAKIGN